MLRPPRVQKLSAAKQRRLDELLNKNSEGTIADQERRMLEKLVSEAEQLMVENGLQLESKSNSSCLDDLNFAWPIPFVSDLVSTDP